ncbi:ATP-binding cassette sub-family B member 6-like [Mytilus californianus]|uniref:ATP-binding cassette sub-family B member 6-like n=1 Tax=Mytilus californianus TaxID=6549 RepID=UPI002245E433|nr:ATP-binding cassette sub-family B member 6-like [Mytilus californianus]
MMKYCGDQLNITDIWIDEGINQCFLDTVTSGLLFVFMLIFGCLQCSMFRKYSTPIDTNTKKGTLGFTFQVLFSLILATEPVIHAVLQDTAIFPQKVYGYQILTMIALFLAWCGSIRLLFLERNKALPTIPTRGHGLVLLMLWTLALIKEHLPLISWWSNRYWWNIKGDSNKIEFGLWVVRYVCTISVFIIGLKAPGLPRSVHQLLVNDEDAVRGNQGQESTWSNVFKKLKIMIPYVWPKGSLWRQSLVVLCLISLGIGRAVNVFVPIYSKYIVNSLTVVVQSSEDIAVKKTGPEFRWDYILIYCGLKFLCGSATSGFLTNMRSFFWIPVQQYTTRRISVKLFSHLHNLSLRWHLSRKTGEVLRVMDRGTTSMNSLLSYVLFNILPTIIDITIAVVYFITAFNYIFGLLVFLCMAMYLGLTIWITEWRTKYRREMNLMDNQINTKAVDSLLNFETVKYYGASEFETNRYDDAILKYQKAEWKSMATLNVLNTLQNLVITMSTVAGCLLCAWAVVHSLSNLHLTVGDYVLFGTYLMQLYGPLNWLGTYYRMIQQSFVDMENMFDLLDESQEVTDIKDARDIVLKNGEIQFKNVDFYYDPSKQILKSINFTVPAGQTYALVGHSGSGKSTIIRLLFRFYDVTGGQIIIDGQDISKVKQESLRQQIGVVPQDTVLFNDDIRYNIRYSKFTATDEEVDNAADVADIHQRILTFPKKYETVVGERGLKLSGGEKQRVAIARTILKSPAIVLMDEATSALDTKTERNIQTALERVCENRSTIIVAHRLSTIIHAHRILVLQEGEIVEQGSHEELLTANGLYSEMWSEQQTKKEDIDNSSLNGTVENKDS